MQIFELLHLDLIHFYENILSNLEYSRNFVVNSFTKQNATFISVTRKLNLTSYLLYIINIIIIKLYALPVVEKFPDA